MTTKTYMFSVVSFMNKSHVLKAQTLIVFQRATTHRIQSTFSYFCLDFLLNIIHGKF